MKQQTLAHSIDIHVVNDSHSPALIALQLNPAAMDRLGETAEQSVHHPS
jgi:hypothetical protein